MLLSDRLLKRQNNRLQEENKRLKEQVEEYRNLLDYYNEKVHLVEKKEQEYDRMLEYLDAQKKEYQVILDKMKKIKKRMVKDFYGVV